MKRELAILVALCILTGMGFASLDNQPGASPPQADTGTRAKFPITVTNDILSDTTWDDTTLPYHVVQEIWVREDATLTIKPGVTVMFAPGAGLRVKGGIIAEGDALAPIRFMADSGDPSSMHWTGIRLENSTGPCTFDNVVISFSQIGIASWGGETTITNATIEYTHYFGVLAGEDSSVLLSDSFINFTTWAGVITDNRSSARVEYNTIHTANYGIVSYDYALLLANNIERCWVGILAWGDAHLVRNRIINCMDGIHCFHSSPLVEGNRIVRSDGNGTRFINSHAILRNNTLNYNHVGMDIDYDSKHLLDTMENNMVNGMDITESFFVGEQDLVLEDIHLDSGRSLNFDYGSYTAQGSVTLYDCSNVTIRNSTILNSVNAIFATNSTFSVYNTTIHNVGGSQVYLESNAKGYGFNGSVDPDSVTIDGDNSLFQTFDRLRVSVEDYHGNPILGARVLVTESRLVLHDITTDINGMTPVMVVKDRTVSEAGAIPSPLSIEVLAHGYNFHPRTGIYAHQTDSLTFTDLGDIIPPEVLAVSVKDGDRAFPVNGTITVRFDEPMNRTATESAFFITGNVTGSFYWDGFNMTFVPDALDYNTHYTVVISTDATDLQGNSMNSPFSLSFRTVHPPDSGLNTVLIAAALIFVAAGIGGYIMLRKSK